MSEATVELQALLDNNTKLRAEIETLRTKKKEWVARLRAINDGHVTEESFWERIALLSSMDDFDE